MLSSAEQGEVNEVKRAVALLNRLVMVAQRANKSQRLYSKNENHYPPSPLYKLPAAIPDDPATVEMFNDVNSVENNSDGSPDQKAMALPRVSESHSLRQHLMHVNYAPIFRFNTFKCCDSSMQRYRQVRPSVL